MSHNIHFYIMKQSLHLLVFLTTFTLSVGSAMAQGEPSKGRVPEHTAFDNVSIGVEASTTGIGLSVATPLHRAFTLRGGFNVLPFSYRYTYDDFAPLTVAGTEVAIPGLGLKASSRMYTGHLIVDWVPFRRGTSTFFLAAGLYFGGSRLLDVTGRFDPAELAAAGIPADQIENIRLDVGGTTIAPNSDGSAEAQLKVNAIRPYVGLGVGRAIPRGRVGFRAEAGAIFHGKPSIASPNIVEQTPASELDGFNKFLSKWKIYPVLSLKMTVKIGKD